jgi:hypothetical protein
MSVVQLFANTGIQYVNTGVKADTPAIWTRLRDNAGTPIPWLYCRAADGYRVLAIDTQTGPTELGYFAQSESAYNDPAAIVEAIGGEAIAEPVVLRILPAAGGAGEPVDVALMLDFGNCRSMGLFVERDASARTLQTITQPFRLYDHRRFGIDQFHREAPPKGITDALKAPPHEEVFDSKFELVSDLIPRVLVSTYEERAARAPDAPQAPGKVGWLKKRLPTGKPELRPEPVPLVKVTKDSGLFPDFSPLRLGAEADDFRIRVDPAQGILTGMSSPKRYLWASRPIDGNYWHHILASWLVDPQRPVSCEPLRGKVLEYIYENDRDWDRLPVDDGAHSPPAAPVTPQYPCRVMVILALYELLSQAFSQINSIAYRERTSSPLRKRRLSHLVLSFPTAMCAHEKARYRKQAEKALAIFAHACLRHQGAAPELRMQTDEGTAGQLAYVYGEVLACHTGRTWLDLVGRTHPETSKKTFRLASLDIGGGTTDLTIADYTDIADARLQTHLICEIKYLDGMTKAGDELVKHLLERILIPQVANHLGVGKSKVKAFFETVADPVFSAAKRRWVTQIWIPVARRYLAYAEEENEQATFTLSDACSDQKAIDALWIETRNRGWEAAHPGDVPFRFQRDEFEKVVRSSLGAMLYHFASLIAARDCDALLLAGRTTRLPAVQRLLRWFIPLPKSRVIPLDRYHAGPWYPFQDARHPGRIADPKSSVVVGSAIEYLCSIGRAPGDIRVEIHKSEALHHSFYWGIAREDDRHFRNDDAFFQPVEELPEDEANLATFTFVGMEALIARRLSPSEAAEVSPIYSIGVRSRKRHGPITVTIERSRTPSREECLRLVKAEGEVDGAPAEAGRNVVMELRTLFEERYFLDTEAFYGIDYDAITED